MEVKNLPEAAKKALEEAGIDISAVVCVDMQGEIHMMKTNDARSIDTKFPIATTAIEGITSISIVRHKGSDCWTYTIGGVEVTICIP